MSGFKSQVIGGQREKFVRLHNPDSASSSNGSSHRFAFNIEGLKRNFYGAQNPSKESYAGIMGPEGLKTFSKSLRSGVQRAVFPEDLKVANNKVFDPQDKSLLFWNRLFVLSCIVAVSVDPLFFYLPIVDHNNECLGMDNKLAVTITTLRTMIDAFYLIHMAFQFRTAYIAPSSRVFGRGELVIDTLQIAKRYLRRWFFVDFLAVLPLPQIVVLKYIVKVEGRAILETKASLLAIVFVQYIFRFARFYPLTSNLKKTAGVFTESSWLGAAYYMLWYMLCSHICGALWYLFALERIDTCWQQACLNEGPEKCNEDFLYCGNHYFDDYAEWRNISSEVLEKLCSGEDDADFKFGIYGIALGSKVAETTTFLTKFLYCLWWGLQNLSTLGQGLETSLYQGEVIFSIFLGVSGLILMALLIGNMQTYLQSLTVRLEEMRLKRRDAEQWMHHRLLPQELRERVRRYNQYKWLETRGVDEETIVQSLPKDLRRDIKRHLCLNLVRRVPLFANMDDRLLDAVCERLVPSLFTKHTFAVREGDPVDEMLFVIRGRLESVTTDGGRSGFYNRGFLKEGDFCGEELLTWALDPRASSNLPLSTRTVRALTEVECFALTADDLKFVAGQFRRLHSKQVQHTFRFYSQQWRTWSACFIQAAWRRHMRRKLAELQYLEEEEDDYDDRGDRKLVKRRGEKGGSSSLAATIYVSKFAKQAMNRIRRLRSSASSTSSIPLQKPSEPDFSSME